MKRQYLGDSKDSFKWDYHHFLVQALGYSQLKIAWMMTLDDLSSDGQTTPERFHAKQEVLTFCNRLRSCREPSLLSDLPATTGASYSVSFHKPECHLDRNNRSSYFSTIELNPNQVLFIDPDNGFEPEKSCSQKHVRYAELETILNGSPPNSVVTVFQHHRRKKFSEDFSCIRERLRIGHSTAIHWHSLMFVSLSLSPETIARVNEINHEYAKNHQVNVLT